MISKSYSTTTNEVSKEQLWKVMSNINDWKKWDDTVEFSELQGDFKTSSTFILKPKGGPMVKIKLMEVKPFTYFKDCTSFPLAKMYGEHWYEETPQGVKITITMTITGILAFLWYKIVMKGIVEHLPEDAKNQIKASRKL
jgi:hypothetical protein